MAREKRSQAQLDFDYTKHGWAFCNRPMLEGKLERLREIAKSLGPLDHRHEIVETIEITLNEMR